jgi:soluble P-type ATPase
MNKSDKQNLDTLKTSYKMYNNTIKQTIEKLSEAMNPDGSKRYTKEHIDEKVALIKQLQEDIVVKYAMVGGDPNDLLSMKEETNNNLKKKRVLLWKKKK